MKDFLTLDEIKHLNQSQPDILEMIEEEMAIKRQDQAHQMAIIMKEENRYQKAITFLFPLFIVLACIVLFAGCRSHVQWVDKNYAQAEPEKGVVAYAFGRDKERDEALILAQTFCAPLFAQVVSETRIQEFVGGRNVNVFGGGPAIVASAIMSKRAHQRLSPLVYVSFNCTEKGK